MLGGGGNWSSHSLLRDRPLTMTIMRISHVGRTTNRANFFRKKREINQGSIANFKTSYISWALLLLHE
jgi:hypothetical protein